MLAFLVLGYFGAVEEGGWKNKEVLALGSSPFCFSGIDIS